MGRLLAAGDSMITRRVSVLEGTPGFRGLFDLVQSADAAFTNLEMGTPKEPRVPEANHRGAFLSSDPFVLDELKWFGFNLIGVGNNHVADYGPKGLMDLLGELEARGMAYAGAGPSLGEARAPAYLDTRGGRFALIAANSTAVFNSLAAARRRDNGGRPGVNPLRFATEYVVDKDSFESLRALDQALGTAATTKRRASFSVVLGRGDPAGATQTLRLAGAKFVLGEQPRVATKPHGADVEEICRAIGAARRQADVVAVSVHAHEGPAEDMNSNEPAEFIVDACHRFVDAGADVVLGHGPHMLRPIELRNGKPIFYSLGSLIFEMETLQRFPSEAYETQGLDQACLPPDITDEVSREHDGHPAGFLADAAFWQSVVVSLDFERGAVTEALLHPIVLGMQEARHGRGAPSLASAQEGEQILAELAAISRPYGTAIDIRQEGGRAVGHLQIKS